MKKIHFNVKTDGFYGVYWKCKTPVDITIIAMLGNDPKVIWRNRVQNGSRRTA